MEPREMLKQVQHDALVVWDDHTSVWRRLVCAVHLHYLEGLGVGGYDFKIAFRAQKKRLMVKIFEEVG